VNHWLRFRYMEPMKIINNDTGKPTGESVVYLRAIRSDGYLYQVHMTVNDLYIENSKGVMFAIMGYLRIKLEQWINDLPVFPPMDNVDAYKGATGWVEASPQ
jgi:hypothetical protein